MGAGQSMLMEAGLWWTLDVDGGWTVDVDGSRTVVDSRC